MSYAISGGHRKTVEAAEIILQQGGNAVDAAIAAYLVSFLSEPCMASVGAGGFAMVNDLENIHLVDFFCQTPREKKKTADIDFYPITIDFGKTTEDFHIGKGSIAVPGAIAGIFAMHSKWGSIPLKDVFEPAIQWSKAGISIDRFQAYDLHLLQDIFNKQEDGRRLMFHAEGELKKEGDLLFMPGYHDFLTSLLKEGRDLVYRGEISKMVSTDLSESGHLSREDFEKYQVNIQRPLSFEFMNNLVHAPSYPSVGGMLLTSLLNTFQDSVSRENFPFLSMQHFQHLVKSMKSTLKFKNDPKLISNYLIQNFGISAPIYNQSIGSKWGGTSHFNVVDKNGMTVALTTSIGEGSGYFIPGTDMQMNNMLGEEALMPNGFHNWDQNVRLQSMMSPIILTNEKGKTLAALGSGGAGRIPYALFQVIVNLIYLEKGMEEAVEAPRIHINGNVLECEAGFEADLSDLPNVNIWNDRSLFFGGVNTIVGKKGKFLGYADARRFGFVSSGD